MIGVAVQTVRPDKRNDQRWNSHSERFAEKLCQRAKESCVFRRSIFTTDRYYS